MVDFINNIPETPTSRAEKISQQCSQPEPFRVTINSLGDRSFCREYGVKYPYMAGAMAQGIASTKLVEALANAGMLGSYGAAGLALDVINSDIDKLIENLGSKPFAVNLIHNPSDLKWEMDLVEILLHKKVSIVEASAFMALTEAIVYYRVKGLRRKADGSIHCRNRVIAKVSRREVAEKFMSPPPQKLLNSLLNKNLISSEEAELSSQISMADDITAEADSGGHTDNRPALTLLPTIVNLRHQNHEKYSFTKQIRVGAAGGLGTPESIAAVLTMGAAYVVTGTINQACIESGTSDEARKMLAETRQADVMMAPAADMFEMGVKVQVLKRGTLFPMRAQKLYEIYRNNSGVESLSTSETKILESQYFQKSLAAEWASTKAFFLKRDPAQIERAERDSKHKLALLFRSYLGQASIWAKQGQLSRKAEDNYQEKQIFKSGVALLWGRLTAGQKEVA